MPPYNSVKDLQSLALDQVCEYVIDLTPRMKKDVNELREYFINNVHARARQSILYRTNSLLYQEICDEHQEFLESRVSKAVLSRWLPIANVMLNIGVNNMPCLSFYGGMEREFNEFVSILSCCNTHLKELHMPFRMLSEHDFTPKMYISMYTLHKTLHGGLASKLVILKLGAICDNLILKTIGENCLCLKDLDVSGSRNIDDGGIKHLLFKNDVYVETNNASNDTLCQHLSQLYDNTTMLNQCCFTLEELRIQNTGTKDASLLMILACVKSLKTLGGFLSFRNIGDALVSVWENSPKPRTFSLTELYDKQLTGKKIAALKECLPHLKKLYTRLSCLCTPQDFVNPEHGSMFWSRVGTLTIDLDYMMDFHLMNIVYNYGQNLVELRVLYQKADIDVAKILESCPNLLELIGFLRIFEMPNGQFTKLKSIQLHMSTAETITWFFENCPCLEEATLLNDSRYMSWNVQVFYEPSFIVCNNLKKLDINFIDEQPLINHETVIKFIDKCSNLQYLGKLETWNLDKRIVKILKKHVKRMNYKLSIF